MRAFEASLIGAGLLIVAAATWAGASTYPVVPPAGGSGGGGGISQAQADARYLQQSGGTVDGNQAVTGNLTLSGATSRLILGGTADGTDIQSADWQPLKIDLRNGSELDILGGTGLLVDCSSGASCMSKVRADTVGHGLVLENNTVSQATHFSPNVDGTGLSLTVGNGDFTAGTNLYIDPAGYSGTHVLVGTTVPAGEKMQVAGNATGAIRAQYDSGGTSPPPGLYLVNSSPSISQYAPTVLFHGAYGRCHRWIQTGIDMVAQFKNEPCNSGGWTNLLYLSGAGITTTLTLYADGPVMNDSAANGGAVFINDDVKIAGRLDYGTAKTSPPACAADADVGVTTKYSKGGGATISMCLCTKLAGTYTLTALGTGDCT